MCKRCTWYTKKREVDGLSDKAPRWRGAERTMVREHRSTSKATQYERAATSERSSEEEHKADALALGADEGRDKLRKAAVRSKYPLTRRCPNEGTHLW